ncbi:hypothetical protein QUB13_08945 [Microcoleus sp. B4-D4]
MDNTLKLWNLTTGTELKTLTGHTAYNAIAIIWDEQRAISADLESGEAIATFSLILLHRCVQWSRFLTARRDRATNLNFLRDRWRGTIDIVSATYEFLWSDIKKHNTGTLQQLFPKPNHRVTCNAIATSSRFCCIYGLFDYNTQPE